MSTAAQQLADTRELAAELFHSLSQPLAVVQCSLELALANDCSVEEYRASLESALENTERLRQRLILARDLMDADGPGETEEKVALDLLLRELRRDLLPLAEARSCDLQVGGVSILVRASAAKLSRAFFCLLEFLLSSPGIAGVRVQVARGDGAQVSITMAAQDPVLIEKLQQQNSSQLRIAHSIFRVLGGGWRLHSPAPGQVCCTVYLPIEGFQN